MGDVPIVCCCGIFFFVAFIGFGALGDILMVPLESQRGNHPGLFPQTHCR